MSQTSREKATAAFFQYKGKIDNLLANLNAMSEDNFNTDINYVNWGDVGSLSHIADVLQKVVNFAEGVED